MAGDARSAALHQGVARELGIEIIDRTWAGERPRTLEDVQDRFGVSRTVAREASRQLEAMGLLRILRRRGLVPQPPESWNVLDPLLIDWRLHSADREQQLRSLTHLRMAIEPAAAANTAAHATIHVRAQLLALASELRRTGEAGDLGTFMEHDIAFHSLLLTSSGNEMFAALSGLVAAVLQGRTELDLMPAHPKQEALAAHEAVADAVFRGDPAAARAAMEVILAEVREAIAED
ncbi:MAG: FCD domain-containing protein [Propioniciclava sp.]|uniref:FadR/GntR family transcriptional regulator n=1 Tax=Propioniciclava sp. TaxID=2038686 RepID=UPI0039E27478